MRKPARRIPNVEMVSIPSPLDPRLLIPDNRRVVRSLNISASVGNWDGDAEVDGLVLRVQPLDWFDNVVPVDGSIDVELTTETKLWTGGQPVVRDDNFNVSERWSVPIQANGFAPTGTLVRLPFRSIRPERDFNIASDACVTARLRLPTAGAFDATDPFVVLRKANRFRDDLQQRQKRRLLSIESDK